MSQLASTVTVRRKAVNTVMLGLTGICTLITVSVLFFILGYLFIHGAASLSWEFFTQLPKPTGVPGGGVANALVGSAKILAIAILIGVPIGFLAGVYLSEYSSKTFAYIVRYFTDLLNGVPSIVIGIFAYSIIVLPMKRYSTMAGGIALGVMMIPIAVRTTEQFLQAVPGALREGAMALGATKWTTISTVVIPAATSGLLSGMMLNLARVSGETAPLLFTALGNQFWSKGWLQPTSALPVVIYQYAISPYNDLHELAWAAGFVLLMLVLLINIAARAILARGGQGRG